MEEIQNKLSMIEDLYNDLSTDIDKFISKAQDATYEIEPILDELRKHIPVNEVYKFDKILDIIKEVLDV